MKESCGDGLRFKRKKFNLDRNHRRTLLSIINYAFKLLTLYLLYPFEIVFGYAQLHFIRLEL